MHNKKLLSIIMLALLSLSLCACNKSETTNSTPENTVVSEQSEEPSDDTVEGESDETADSATPDEETPNAQEETEPDTSEEQYEEPTPMVDWETFAAQEDNDDICLAVQNATSEKILYSEQNSDAGIFYKVQDGDRFAIPIRDSIFDISLFKDQNTETIETNTLFLRADGVEIPPYVEIECQKGYSYFVHIILTDETFYNFYICNE